MLTESMGEVKSWRWMKIARWILSIAAILVWVGVVGFHHWRRASLLTALAAASFTIGALIGFVFTTYDEESSTIGKVKDWLIASLAAVTLVKLSSLKFTLYDFTLHHTGPEFALSLSIAVVFAGLGFFYMFFSRELLFNVSLARERAARNQIETSHAGIVTIQLLSALPSSILVGIDDAKDLLKSRPAEADALQAVLWSPDVDTFLKQSDAVIAASGTLDWDVVSKNAYLHYYRTYFPGRGEKSAQIKMAVDWVVRALVINPHHVDFTVRHSDLLGMQKRYHEAVHVLKRLHPLPECPAFVDQWLGYFGLFQRDCEDEVIRFSSRYLASFPESNECRLNLACAYAQKFSKECRAGHGSYDRKSESYKAAMGNLRLAIENDHENLAIIREKWIADTRSFTCFVNDLDFIDLVKSQSGGLRAVDVAAPTAAPGRRKALKRRWRSRPVCSLLRLAANLHRRAATKGGEPAIMD